MNYEVRLTTEAENDLRGIFEYIAFQPNLPNLLYIGHLTYLWNPYKINVFGLFSFTFICIIDIIIFSDYTYVWGNRRGISGIFEKQKWYYIRV